MAGQPVQFSDTSTGNPTSWEWAFGDGATSTTKDPSHTYAAAGAYSVSLTIRTASNSSSASRTITVTPQAAGYYIDANNPSASDSNPGTENHPWKTINKANQTLAPGDTVFIKAGTYTTYIAPNDSGTASNRIIYRAYGSDIVTVRDASYGILLDGKSYITVQGISFYNLDKFLWLQNGANHNIIAYCNFDQGRNIGWSGSKIYRSSSYNWVHHCRFSNYGEYTSNSVGSVLDIGNEESTTDISNFNLLEDSLLFHGGHHVLGVYGQFNVIRNNYFHNENWLNDHGERNVYVAGYPMNSGHNLFEGNQIAYSGFPVANWGASGMSLDNGYNIIRFNRFYYNNLCGIGMSTTSSYYSDVVYNKIYNNTFLHNGYNMSTGPDPMTSAIGFAIYSGTHVIKFNALKNNLYYDHYQALGVYQVSLDDQIIANNWNGDTQGDPFFVNAPLTLGDPTNANLPDLHLQASSPCIDKGSFLTTITSPSGAGTTFTVADAGYFMDGWGISEVNGDDIQIVGTSQKARIAKVDYVTNAITLDTTLSWTQNQGIALAYVGSAPDVGAFEHGGLQAQIAGRTSKNPG